MKKELALYVHWPWCKKKCPYCDFNSHVTTTIPESEYVQALLADLKFQANHFGLAGQKVSSIFFGGGTPSLMSVAAVAEIINAAATVFQFENPEITLEANPTSSAAEKFKDFVGVGVNRFSIGVQGLDETELTFLGREHTAREALAVVDMALNATPNVNFDLIYGLPHQPLARWHEQLNWAVGKGVAHISAYQLTIEPNTVFYAQVNKGTWQPVDNETEADFFDLTRRVLTEVGYENYEISNFARPGFACRHNVHVWEYKPYLGIGAGAHGRVNGFATATYKMPESYMKNAAKNPFAVYTQLDNQTADEERLMMGLRLAKGIIPPPRFDNQINLLIKDGFLEKNEDGRTRLTPQGWPVLNGVLRKIINI